MGTRVKSANNVIESGLIYGVDPADTTKANNPYVSPDGALYVFDMAGNGYDPSIGRTLVESANNYQYIRYLNNAGTVAYQGVFGTSANLTAATHGFVVKAAPGYLKRVKIRNVAAFTGVTLNSIVLSDSASGTTGRIFQFDIPAVGSVIETNFDILLTLGINIVFSFSGYTSATAGDIELLVEYR